MLVRGALATLSVVLVLVFLVLAIAAWTPITIVKNKELTDLLKAAIDLKVEQSRSEFQIGLLALGALWGLIIAKRDEAQIIWADMPEVLMFAASTFLLLISVIFHIIYVENIAYVFALAGGIEKGTSIPDVFSSGFNNPYEYQLWALIAGLITAGLTFVSAHRLR